MKKMLFTLTPNDTETYDTQLFLVPLSDEEFTLALEWDGHDIFDSDHPKILYLAYAISEPYDGVFERMESHKVPQVWLSRLRPHRLVDPCSIQCDGFVRCTLDI